jgi:zinicin-like metallopeptidase
VAIEVSPESVPDPVRGDVYTLGVCIPLTWSGSGADLESRVVLYYGSFAALARSGGFAWRDEAWETLLHELRHHLEWRASTSALEAYDWAAEENFKRLEGEPFDPSFYRSGEVVREGIYKVDEDVFIEQTAGGDAAQDCTLIWHGRRYRVAVPAAPARATRFLTLTGLGESPPGEAVLVLTPPSSILDLLRRRAPAVGRVVRVEPVDG